MAPNAPNAPNIQQKRGCSQQHQQYIFSFHFSILLIINALALVLGVLGVLGAFFAFGRVVALVFFTI